ncbi:hypothetical protein PGB28_16810 [Primorskyibacter aestuariivivens]|uniref:hypothetical protein n=1 Tax=Primorskyibacter aestuariivivens TaxID=1888912 RepID=UPI0023001A48|nr:hypothetical protein [Primorskyibacter aestuariivivens]MDA7430126.1 hypothetical protein [Primorskyibacter aestuariivivens]
MMIARWHVEAKFGHKNEVIALMKEWNEAVGKQTGLDVAEERMITGSIGAKEAVIETEMEIENLSQLDAFFDKIATVQVHADWGKKMSELVVSGSSYWEIFRVVDA